MFAIDPMSPLPAVGALGVALATTWILTNRFGAPPAEGRFASIDGLRGYLAFFVFLHHSCIWYFYLRTDQWDHPESHVYTNFGQSSVVLFFMITGFLFFSKLLDGKSRPIDWTKLYISRLFRLTPLYFFAISLMFIIVAHLSGWKLNENVPAIAQEVFNWIFFTIGSGPDVNGVKNTYLILAGAMWTLPYEWLFYISLPLIALFVKVRPKLLYIILSIAATGIVLNLVHPRKVELLPFLGGMLAAFMVRIDLFRAFATRTAASFITVACIAISVMFFPTAYGLVQIGLLSIAFALIAGGDSMFGILKSPVSRLFGEITYSMYLLHGLILFTFFNFVIGTAEAKELSPMLHWTLVVGITPVLVVTSFLTFRYIEKPGLQLTGVVTSFLKKS
jgi:peptidoglycan/LPS O-acetylase OafA/YrhL